MRKSKINNKGINTTVRFLYLNTYAFLLLLIGGGIMSISLYVINTPLLIAQITLTLICFKGAFSIFNSWTDKKIKYEILMNRNKYNFRRDTFKEFMTAPCGRLLVKVVLSDLDKTHKYKELTIYRQSIIKEIKNCTKPRRTKIKIHSDNTKIYSSIVPKYQNQ